MTRPLLACCVYSILGSCNILMQIQTYTHTHSVIHLKDKECPGHNLKRRSVPIDIIHIFFNNFFQYQNAFVPRRLQNWEVPMMHREVCVYSSFSQLTVNSFLLLSYLQDVCNSMVLFENLRSVFLKVKSNHFLHWRVFFTLIQWSTF